MGPSVKKVIKLFCGGVALVGLALLALVSQTLRGALPNADAPIDLRGCEFSAERSCFPSESEQLDSERYLSNVFGERPLASYCADTSYRMVLFPAFDPTIVVRIVIYGDKPVITVKRLNQSGRRYFESTRPLTDDEWEGIQTRIEAAEFWFTAPYRDEIPVTDGAFWELEGRKGNRQTRVSRILPDDDLKSAMVGFLDLAGELDRYSKY